MPMPTPDPAEPAAAAPGPTALDGAAPDPAAPDPAAAAAAFAAAADRRTVADLRAGDGLKWSLVPGRIGAFVAESDLGTAPAVREALGEAVAAERLGYLPPHLTAAMAEAFTGFAADRYGWAVDPARVRPVADVLAAFRAAIAHFSAPGSTIVLPTPAYMPFLTVPGTMGRRVVQVPLVPDGDRLVHDLDAIGAALRTGGADGGSGGLLVLCNPHNPTGRVLDRAELRGIAQVVDAHGARVFADEIHAPLVYGGHRHVPYASVDPVAAAHALTATSASKAWNLPGIKCAQVVLGSAADAARWAEVGEEHEHGAATLGVIGATAAYRDGGPWLDALLTYLDGNRRLLADLLATHLPAVRYRPPEGTYLAWLDCRDLGLGDHPARTFAEHGVLLTDGPACGEAGRGFARWTLATPRPVLAETVALLGAAVAAG